MLECMCIVHVWGHECRLMHGRRNAVVKETSASPLGRLLQEGCWRAKLVACCYHTRRCPSSTQLLGFKKVQSQTLECLYIPVMLWVFCMPAGLYKAVSINHKNWSNLLKSVPVTIFRRPVLPCKMIWFSSFVTCAFILWRKNWIIVIEGLNMIWYINVFLGSTMWPSYTHSSHTLWKMSRMVLSDVQKVFHYRFFLKTVRCSQAGRITGCLETGSVSIVENRFSGKRPARRLAWMSS